ncbi:MAG: sigma-70 family RNA polymerase sigma factor [Bacteroidota bacterium]
MESNEFNSRLVGYQKDLERLSRTFTTDPDDSMDLVQETYFKALKYKDKFRADTNFKGWLFTIMRNTYINKYRKKKTDKTYNDLTENAFHLNVQDSHTFHSPEKSLEYQDTWDKVGEIKEYWSQPFKMQFSGYHYQEIADHIGIPLGTVKNRIFMARQAIQKLVER